MSLDNIKLPPIVIQQLFTRSLVDYKKEKVAEEKAAVKRFAVLGNNRRHIIILVDNDEMLYLPDEELNFLFRILSACHLFMEDVAILNVKKNAAFSYKILNEEFQPEKIFLFGVSPAQIELPLDFPHYQIQRYNNQTYLYTPPLSHFFHNNNAEKTKLWNCLRQIFGI